MKHLLSNTLLLCSSFLLICTASGNCQLPLGVGSYFPGVVVDITDDTPQDNIIDTICLPLRSMDITAVVVDGIVEVTMTQEFDTSVSTLVLDEWPALNQTQARYQLPLDEQAAVTAFRAEIGDRIIEGEVKDKDQAKKEFDEAVEEGKPAFLAEQNEPDIFELSCGNLPANQVVRVTLVYVAPMTVLDAETYRFVLPTKIAPRFNPRVGTEDPSLPPLINTGVKISLGCIMSNEVNVESTTHEFQVIQITSTVTAIEVSDTNPLERDVVIDLKAQSLAADPQVFIDQDDDGTSAMMLSWVPQPDPSTSSDGSDKEWIFILDRSGSMQGTKIDQLRAAMLLILKYLHPSSLFNIVSFGSSFEFLFSEGSKRRSDQDAYNTAVAEINTMTGNFGGTVILDPIQAVLNSSAIPTHQRIVFLITDGQVSNEDEIIEYVGDNLGSSTRVFTLGIGYSPARELLNGVARNGDGTSDYVNGETNDAIAEAIQRQMATAMDTSNSTIVSINWGGVTGTQSPFEYPNLFVGRRFLQYFLANTTSPVGDVVVNVWIGSSPTSYTIQSSAFIQSNAIFESDVIHSIAARELIRDLEEGRSPLHSNGNVPTDDQVAAEIVRIGVKYQIVSSETSFVAVDNEGWQALSSDSTDPSDEVENNAVSFLPGFCFPADGMVSVEGKGFVSMRNLSIGDDVYIGNNQYSRVYSFGHRDHYRMAKYLQIHVNNMNTEPLEISSDHMVFLADGRAVPAGLVKIGDHLMLGKRNDNAQIESPSGEVRKIAVVHRRGLYAPFTESGTLEVNGVIASSYVSLQGTEYFQIGSVEVMSMHVLSHMFQGYHRITCWFAFESFCKRETYNGEGLSQWTSGPLHASIWFLSQSEYVQGVLGIPILFCAIICSVVGLVMMNLWSVILYVLIAFIITRGEKPLFQLNRRERTKQ